MKTPAHISTLLRQLALEVPAVRVALKKNPDPAKGNEPDREKARAASGPLIPRKEEK